MRINNGSFENYINKQGDVRSWIWTPVLTALTQIASFLTTPEFQQSLMIVFLWKCSTYLKTILFSKYNNKGRCFNLTPFFIPKCENEFVCYAITPYLFNWSHEILQLVNFVIQLSWNYFIEEIIKKNYLHIFFVTDVQVPIRPFNKVYNISINTIWLRPKFGRY